MENIILNSTTETLVIRLDATPSANHTIDITVSYVDINGSTSYVTERRKHKSTPVRVNDDDSCALTSLVCATP